MFHAKTARASGVLVIIAALISKMRHYSHWMQVSNPLGLALRGGVSKGLMCDLLSDQLDSQSLS